MHNTKFFGRPCKEAVNKTNRGGIYMGSITQIFHVQIVYDAIKRHFSPI